MRFKSLELIGFKSFADRTVLDFGEGISAIVGPNGCGKSNVSDAIRWVLGEQSARLLRGTAMQDCIFNGTDSLAPKNMAEVSLTLTDCEQVLGTDYHEVTVTRRVFRSGEGQYFVNKTPCRLKDIQRLFLDTGVGSNSYSVMEQGKIDLILRARPEDRREVFEEASGISKFKADKREALRKLEQTENNLLRLADIIKEVKRQIISIQRQAGKAERHKKMFDQLRGYDVYSSRERLKSMAAEIAAMEAQHASILEKNKALQHDIEKLELNNGSLQEDKEKIEGEISALQQSTMQADAQIEQLRQTLEINNQRVNENQQRIQHDTKEIDEARRNLDGIRKSSAENEENLNNARAKFQEAEENLKIKGGEHARYEKDLDETKSSIDELMAESFALDDRLTKSQNERHQLENSDRGIVIRRERCAAEQANLRIVVEQQQARVGEAEDIMRRMRFDVEEAEKAFQKCSEDIRKNDEYLASARSDIVRRDKDIAAITAQTGMLSHDTDSLLKQSETKNEDALALAAIDHEQTLGRLCEQVKIPPEYRIAFEAVLRDLLNAFILKDVSGAIRLVKELDKVKGQSMSFVIADLPLHLSPSTVPPSQSVCLLDQIQITEQYRPLFTRLLRNVYVVESADFLKEKTDPALVCVTRNGVVMRGSGALQIGAWAKPEQSPMLRQQHYEELNGRLLLLNAKNAEAQKSYSEVVASHDKQKKDLIKMQAELDAKRQVLAGHKGQHLVIKSEADKTRDNLETVSLELKEIEKQDSSTERKSELIITMDKSNARRVAVKRAIEELNGKIKTLELSHKEMQAEVMDANVSVVRHRDEVSHLTQMGATQTERITQLGSLVKNRGDRILEYEKAILSFNNINSESTVRLPVLEEQKVNNAGQIKLIKDNRGKILLECKNAEEKLKRLLSPPESREIL
ncbi:AAA family ATPase [Verrucomicrobiota bacterium]